MAFNQKSETSLATCDLPTIKLLFIVFGQQTIAMRSSLRKLQSVMICLRSMPSLAGSPAAAQSLMAMQLNSFSTAHAGASNGLAACQPHCCSHWPTAMPAQGRGWSPLPWHIQVGPAEAACRPHMLMHPYTLQLQLQAAHYASSGPQVKFKGSKLKPYT